MGESRRAFGHMCYYSLIVQHHLPHLLPSHDTTQRFDLKVACVNASREFLKREIELRTFNSISACCRMSDLLALIAEIALMLGHATSHGDNEEDCSLAQQRSGDRATVSKAMDYIDPISELQGDMTVRLAALLRALLAIEDDAACRHGLLAYPPNGAQSQHEMLIMRAAHLGNVRVSHDGVSTSSSEATMDQSQHMAGGVAIGGIGTMILRLRDSAQAEHQFRVRDFGAASFAQRSGERNTGEAGSGRAQNGGPQATAMQNTRLAEFDAAPPLSAVSFDDFAFHGLTPLTWKCNSGRVLLRLQTRTAQYIGRFENFRRIHDANRP
jgi:hypothetical protein